MEKLLYSGTNEIIYYEKMPNGLDVYLLPNKNTENYYLTFNTKFGSIYTEFNIGNNDKVHKIPNGVAHFLEHLTFKMEDGLDASEKFSDLGSSSNAFTSHKITCYEVWGSNNIKENLEYLLDYVQKPYYTQENVEAEKGIICEEINMYADSPGSKLMDEVHQSIFVNSNYKYKVSGETKDVENTTLEDIKLAYDTFYHPSNMFVVITGNINPEEVLAIIEENQSKKVFKKQDKIKIVNQNEPNNINKEKVTVEGNVEIDKICISLKIAKSIFKPLNISPTELHVYLRVLLNSCFGQSSELQEVLTKGNITPSGLYLNKRDYDNHIVINIIAETPYKERFMTKIKEQLENLNVSEEDLNRKKKVMISNYLQSFDDIESSCYGIQMDIIDNGKIELDYFNIYNNLNMETLNKIIKKIPVNNISTVILTKEEN